MKKWLLATMILLAGAGIIQARDNYARDIKTLPAAAQAEIKNNFKAGVSVIKIDKDLGRISEYEVILTDGTEITYDSKGNWKDVEVAPNHEVPAVYVPAPVREYVKKSHKGTKIVGIEKERKGYEVTLSNGIDIKFSADGSFLKYD
ncbi:MAG: PepSY-like domain-containing protein [Muribaculaceae bacterium]|nr:PepSY-like domain-containing protein [Muribaculaceae bacterium]